MCNEFEDSRAKGVKLIRPTATAGAIHFGEVLNMTRSMKFAAQLLTLGAVVFAGCRTAHDVAVTSFRVIDAPASFLRRQIDQSDPGTTTTTTTTRYQSDAVIPGRPIAGPQPPSPDGQRRVVSSQRSAPDSGSSSPERRAKSSPPPRSAATQGATVPYARPVPGKPGYVYSPFDPNGGYVDVTGYKPGSKAKDPYSGKIFIVP